MCIIPHSQCLQIQRDFARGRHLLSRAKNSHRNNFDSNNRDQGYAYLSAREQMVWKKQKGLGKHCSCTCCQVTCPSTGRLQSSKDWHGPMRRPCYPDSCTTLKTHFAHSREFCMCLAFWHTHFCCLQYHMSLISSWHSTVKPVEISIFTCAIQSKGLLLQLCHVKSKAT